MHCYTASSAIARPRPIGLLLLSLAVTGDLGSGRALAAGQVVQETIRFASTVPGAIGTPVTIAIPIRLRIPQLLALRGYRIVASSSFIFQPSGPSSQGKSIAATDFIVGVGPVTDPTGAPPAVTVNPGFEKDPSTAFGRPAGGPPPGFKTVADLQSGVEILRIDKLPPNKTSPSGNEIGLTLRVAVRPQYFTPGNYSGTISLMALN